MLLMSYETQEAESTESPAIPPTVALLMSAIEAGEYSVDERRETRRILYRVTTHLRLFRDDPQTPGWRLYTRDINRRGLGFITPHRLPLGYGGIVMLKGSSGRMEPVHCTLSRCREASPGWFEGCLHFNREQPQYDVANSDRFSDD
jgi:hypothetical protein